MVLFFRLLYCCLLVLTSRHASGEWFNDRQAVMGTEVRVNLWHDDASVAKAAIRDVFEIMEGVDRRLSPYKPTSDLSRLNRDAATKSVKLTDELALLYKQSQWAYNVSDGAFDITFASVGQYYDYREKKVPSHQQLKQRLPALSTQHLQFDQVANTLRFLHPEVALDLGGIAKGYAVDLAVEAIQQQGIQHAYISAGGDSRVLGDRGNRPWLVGIKNPRQGADGAETVITLPIKDAAVSTSGDYERFFIDEKTGDRIHHIINPQTGRSARGVMSVTIIGESGLTTDPLSTAVFVLGVQKGITLINRLDSYDAIIIDSAGQVHYSNGLMPPVQPAK